ncbi:bifunctional uroporphyrinogen-III synthetase/uroporphyrin-III C-methyltransferase [Variovorax sp. PBL-H6]|uniref:uroporphyrinogen-III synthase n=1 Tax=Variovorax sp. PBL-H6 TaxID=434009 RepID=UPI001316F30D|nr:uroporphyrinogen-III synthase [Variovorax sp. PBL-H6]VTU35692.1 bifunctional uroporphyrinogen-III synthetase/uroporphyrin-III C-methyltransferase [Variovorax sp. PBL-H6]
MPAPRVIVTRPAREAARSVEALRTAGLDARALPLIGIAPVVDRRDLDAALQRLGHYAAVMFVSAAAVEHFFDAAGVIAGGLRPRCWATGPGTVRALQQAGVAASAIDAPGADAGQFDSEALWARVRTQVGPGLRVLIVRGGDSAGQPAGRAWLSREIVAAGGACDIVVAYRRIAAPFGEAEQALAAEGARGEAIWLFSSAEAIARLRAAMPGTAWASARAVATHPRIAEAARAAGFGAVRISSATPGALVASIESFA